MKTLLPFSKFLREKCVLLNPKGFSPCFIQYACIIYIPQVYDFVGQVVRWSFWVFFITYDSYKSSEGLKFLFNTSLLCYFRCCQYDSWMCTLKVMFPVFSSMQDQVSRRLHDKCISLFGMTKKHLFFCISSTKSKSPGLNLLRQLFARSRCFSPFSRLSFLNWKHKLQKSTEKKKIL